MNGDSWMLALTVVGTGAVLLIGLGGVAWKLGRIDQAVKALSNVWDHVGDVENRMTKLETEHKCCPVCKRNGHRKTE